MPECIGCLVNKSHLDFCPVCEDELCKDCYDEEYIYELEEDLFNRYRIKFHTRPCGRCVIDTRGSLIQQETCDRLPKGPCSSCKVVLPVLKMDYDTSLKSYLCTNCVK